MMQRMILRTITAMSVVCLCFLVPIQVLANVSDYGPEMDPLISDESENISLTCPPPTTVDCDDNGIYMTFEEFEAAGGSVSIPDGCEVDSFTFVADVLVSQNGCTFVYMREYFVAETCGNTFTCNQIIMLTDDDNPFIVDCPSDTTFQVSTAPCTVAFDVPDVTTTDGCSAVTVTSDAPSEFPVGSTTVTYTATDGCGNSSQCSFVVTVETDNELTVECPPAIIDSTVCDISEVPEYADFAAFEGAGGSVSGDCSTMSTTYTIDNVNDVIIGGSCPQTVNRTYTISDEFGNEASCIQVITLVDTMKPTFTVPADVMGVDCAMAMDTAVTGSPSNIMDNCDDNPTVTFFDVFLSAGACEAENVFTRLWMVEDACGNVQSAVQTISPIDTTPPVAICKDTLVVYLDENGNTDIEPEDLDNGSTDACSEVTFDADMTFASCNQVNSPIPVPLQVFDGCNNMATCDVVLVVLDTMDVVLNSPENDTVPCLADIDPIFDNIDDFELLGGGTVEDNCPSGSTFSMIEADTAGVCPITVTRVYEYTDVSGNSDTALHTIYVIDTVPPIIASCPDDISISETDICDTLLVFGLPTLMEDNCGDVIITNNYTNDTSSMAVFSGGVTEILFTATDGCGNSDTCSMTVTVDAAPKITCPPMSSIDGEDDLPDYPTIDAFLMAGGEINGFCAFDSMTFTYSNSFVLDMDSCTATIMETVTISDTLGNPTVVTKMSTAMDTINPVISGCFDMFVPLIHATCEIDTTFFLPTVTDNFGVDTTYYTVGDFVNDTAQVVFYAEDYCGNVDFCEFVLIAYDPTSPDIELDDITVMCDTMGAVPIFTTVTEFLTGPGAMIYDCRLDSLSFMHVGDVVDMDGNIVRTYSIQDATGNIGTTSQTITFLDSTNPEFTMCTADIVMDAAADTCGAMVTVPLPTFMDNCDGSLVLTNDYTGTDDASGFYPMGVTSVIWTVTDDNGLFDTCSFTVTITDVTVPAVVCPPDTMILCTIDNYPPYMTISEFIAGEGEASDNCDLMGISSTTLETTGNIYTRTYTITDVNGLENTCVQTIEVIDTTAPELVCVSMIIETTETNTCDKFINITPPTVTDNCNGTIQLTNSLTGSADPSGVFSDTTAITWYAQDEFGNIESCTYNIIVVDGTGPVVTNPDTLVIMCAEMLADVDTFMTVQDIIDAGGSASDNCGIEFINFISQTDIGNDVIKRVYEIVDSTGNTSSLTHCIEIEDTTPPTFDAPADITVECDVDVDDLSITGTVDSMILSDNCMDIDTLIFIDTAIPGVCPIVLEVTRIWILTDNSGNETRDTQYISTIDSKAPTFDSMPSNLADIDCDGDFPPMEVLTATDECTGVTVFMDTLPYVENICLGYDVTYRWIAMDGCQNSDTLTSTFTVNPDNTPPSLINPNDITLDSESDICGVRVDNVPGPTFDEECSLFTLTRNYTDTVYPVGTNNVSWTATNDCGLDSTIIQEVVVEDNILPIPICKDATAGITADPQNYVFASSFIASATDNCGIQSISVRRLTTACDDPDNNVFGDSIHICCDDIGTIVDVEIRIIDDSGNENFCDATLEVDDERAPVVLEPLPNIIVSCTYVFETTDMEVFGSFTMDPSSREDIIIEDVYYENQDSIAGIDGLVTDECVVSISDTTIVELNSCNTGYIRRVFTFTDLSGNMSTSEQLILVQDESPFNQNGTDITWPENYTWNQCGTPAPDTSVSGAPIFANLDKCAQVSASYKDQIFNIPTSVCPKVKRKWKVIDWCQYDEDATPNPGLWTYSQWIYVENNVAPTITTTCADTLICTPYNECSAIASFSVEAEDDCAEDSQFITYSYSINVNSDENTSNDINGNGNTFSHELELGIHEVTWTAIDRCGNDTTCTFSLTIEECKAPTAVCLSGLAIAINVGGEAELWASDVNQSSFDNCTGSDDLIFSFSSDVNDFGKVFDCDDVATPQYIEMWVTDLEGNQSFCSTFVDVQDNNGYCNGLTGNDDSNELKGKIVTETNMSIPEAMVSIIGAEMDNEYMTEEDGEYAFEGINDENDYQIKVERDKDDREGVSTLDLVLIQRHILGLDILDSPYKMIAADINNTESISASDLVELRKIILGINETFPDNESWRFVSMNEEMADMDNPWPFSEDLVVGNAPLEEVKADFVGVKIGDVDNTIENLIGKNVTEGRNNRSLGIVTKDQRVHRDDEVYVDFVSNVNTPLVALQMTIEWDEKAMNFVDVIPVGLMMNEDFVNTSRVDEGILTIAWTSIEGKTVLEGMPMFQLIFEGNESFDLSEKMEISSSLTQARAYDLNNEKYELELRFVEGDKEGMMLFQNRPNPFVAETVVEFALPEDMEVTFKVFNGAGSLIYKKSQDYTEGINTFKLSQELRDHKGILFLKMETAEFSDIKRMLRID